jgi:uncharacterized protein YbcI
VSDTIASLHARHYGRNGGDARAMARQSEKMLTVVLGGVVTPDEQFLIRRGRADLVKGFHLAFQRAMREEFVGAVERSVGRPVRAVSSSFDVGRETAVETFLLGDGLVPPSRRFQRS